MIKFRDQTQMAHPQSAPFPISYIYPKTTHNPPDMLIFRYILIDMDKSEVFVYSYGKVCSLCDLYKSNENYTALP